jgi:hypothetical protein
MLDLSWLNALFGKKAAWLWAGKTIIGNTSLVFMAGRKGQHTVGIRIENRQQCLSLTGQTEMLNIQL